MNDQKFNVLYVDDEENNLVSFRAAFRRNYNVYTAISGKEAINVLRSYSIPIIITDQRMPQMTGVQLLERIIPEFPDSIRMILTGFSDIEAIVQAINNGRIFRYITKPWDENELKMTIDNAIQLYQVQEKNKQLILELNQKINEQEKTLNLFKRYVPSAIIEKTLNSGAEVSLFDGELREVTSMFCDIRGFTEISATLNPKEVVKILNCFYDVMSDCVRRHNGIINQFIGDEIFATFGALVADANHARNAVYCALEMIQQLREVNDKFSSLAKRNIAVGIGINTGEALVGNLGSEDKIEFSCTGDTINTTKRIEQLTQELTNTILISNSTFEETGSQLKVKSWEPVLVKGKKDSLLVHEVISRS